MTSSDLVVANIAHNRDGPAKLHLERLLKVTDDNRTGTGIAGYAEVSSNNVVSLSKGSVHADAELRKARNKGLKATLRVQHLLTGTSKDKDMENDGQPTMVIGDTSIVGGPPTDCRAKGFFGIASHEKVAFRLPLTSEHPTMSRIAPVASRTGEKTVSTQYLHFSCQTLKIEDAMVNIDGRPMYDGISIVSGICLFSNNILKSCDISDGTADVTPLIHARPTIYEAEHIARAAPAIADLACTILSRNKILNITTPLTINLDIPNWHYYKAVDEKLQSGLCTANNALQYFEAIERRFDQLSSVFETAIRHECALRGEADPKINVWSRMNIVSEFIKSALKNGIRPDFQTAMQILDEEEGGVWRQFYQLVPVKERPKSFKDLGYLFYVFQVMKSSFRIQALTQIDDCDFEPSCPAPEEMSICLPTRGNGKLSEDEMDDFLNPSRCEFGFTWSQYQNGRLSGAVADFGDDDDNELSFDASSTVDIRVVSSEVWASTVDGECYDSDDVPESITILEDTSSLETDEDDDMETITCRSPRLIDEDLSMSFTVPSTFHLPPASDAATSAACMLGVQRRDSTSPRCDLGAQHSHDAMFTAFETASSFCFESMDTDSPPSSDDELASHGFMLPSPVISHGFWSRSAGYAVVEEAAPIFADDSMSHAAMLATYKGQPRTKFDMETGITDDDGAALDDIGSFAAMVAVPRATLSRRCSASKVARSQPASKDEHNSCAIMLPTSELASNNCMTQAGWDMKDIASIDAIAAHLAMGEAASSTGGYDQPAGPDEYDSCAAMLPTSEAASSSCMSSFFAVDNASVAEGEQSSHVAMLGTFEKSDSPDMAKEMCMAAAMTPLEHVKEEITVESAADESAAHAAMLCAIADLELHESPSTVTGDLLSDDNTVSNFAMLANADESMSSAFMAAAITRHDAGLHGLSATMPADDHASHTAMSCAELDESSACMARTLGADDVEHANTVVSTTRDLELASHAAMRGIIDLSSSFCMAETLVSAHRPMDIDIAVSRVEEVDHHIAMSPTAADDEASNITMLFLPADEVESHAAMLSDLQSIFQPITAAEHESHVCMLPKVVAALYVGRSASKIIATLDDTEDALASHHVMAPTSTDDTDSHDIMLPTSTDDSASYEVMRPTSNDEKASHSAMIPDLEVTNFDAAEDAAEDIDSHNAMLTSSMCMAATVAPKLCPSLLPISSTTATRTTSACLSSSSTSSTSAGFVKLPKTKKHGKASTDAITKPRVLILSVDDDSERRIYSQSQKLLKKLRADPDAVTYPTLVEAYLMRRVFIDGNAGGSNLYFGDPSPAKLIDDEGREMEPLDVVRKVYGQEAARNLEKWFGDVGLGL